VEIITYQNGKITKNIKNNNLTYSTQIQPKARMKELQILKQHSLNSDTQSVDSA